MACFGGEGKPQYNRLMPILLCLGEGASDCGSHDVQFAMLHALLFMSHKHDGATRHWLIVRHLLFGFKTRIRRRRLKHRDCLLMNSGLLAILAALRNVNGLCHRMMIPRDASYLGYLNPAEV